MTASKQIKGLLAGVAALAFVATAMAQGSPPNPAVKNAPMGAGQQSSQQTPMGTTGTPAGGATTTGSGSTANSGSTGTGSTMGGTTSSSSMGSTGGSTSGTTMGAGSASTDSTMASSSGSTRKANRRARADRN
jgi:hypothetical protein